VYFDLDLVVVDCAVAVVDALDQDVEFGVARQFVKAVRGHLTLFQGELSVNTHSAFDVFLFPRVECFDVNVFRLKLFICVDDFFLAIRDWSMFWLKWFIVFDFFVNFYLKI